VIRMEYQKEPPVVHYYGVLRKMQRKNNAGKVMCDVCRHYFPKELMLWKNHNHKGQLCIHCKGEENERSIISRMHRRAW
jgi:hypothetical protein